jgi:NAD(P)-dependent dehydrogenase (short-subunit alcohol dehydrogenase family)
MSTKKLAGKVAVVTGASKGIGAAIAKHLAAEGASVVVNYSASKDGAERVVGDIQGSGGRAVAVKANVAKKADIDQLFAEVETEGVHAAGIAESDMRKQVEAQTPLGRIGQPQDIATAAGFFASSDSAWITGETRTVAGGYR